MRTSALFGAKTKDFSKLMVCPYGQGEVEPVRTFCGQEGGGQFFAILCGRLLWTVSNVALHSECRDLDSRVRLWLVQKSV